MKHVWTLDESPARAGRRPGALAEYKALRDANCVCYALRRASDGDGDAVSSM